MKRLYIGTFKKRRAKTSEIVSSKVTLFGLFGGKDGVGKIREKDGGRKTIEY